MVKDRINDIKEATPFELWAFPVLNDISANKPVEECPEQKKESESMQEIKQLHEKLTTQLALFSTINQQLSKTVKEIDETLLMQVISCIKKVIHKIIAVELNKNDTILVGMIQQTIKDLDPHQQCTVLLSPEDYECLQGLELESDISTLQADASLSPGDYKIISPVGGINALLVDRIEAFFSLSK